MRTHSKVLEFCGMLAAFTSLVWAGPFDQLAALQHGKATVRYVPALARVVMKDATPVPDWPYPVTCLVETRLQGDSGATYQVNHDSGPSDDDAFEILRVEGGRPKSLGKICGTGLCIPGDGYLYISGETNDYFDRRRKYRVLEGQLQEVRQPFYFVGLETQATAEVTLYLDKHAHTEVARIPKGGKLTVLLAATDREYLARTEMGLVGWLCSPETVGIFLHGD